MVGIPKLSRNQMISTAVLGAILFKLRVPQGIVNTITGVNTFAELLQAWEGTFTDPKNLPLAAAGVGTIYVFGVPAPFHVKKRVIRRKKKK